MAGAAPASQTLCPSQTEDAQSEPRKNQYVSKPLDVQRIKGGAGTKWTPLLLQLEKRDRY